MNGGPYKLWQACDRCDFAIRSNIYWQGPRSAECKLIQAHEEKYEGHKVRPVVVEARKEYEQ